MIYPDHRGIRVENVPGVCMAGADTLAIAECAGSLPAENALDVGTGTGFIAIHLAKAGVACVATDICERALTTAKENVARNAVDVTCLRSDLFERVSGTFDLITFSTPLVAIGASCSGIARLVRRGFPRASSAVAHLAFLRARRRRARLLADFETGFLKHSNERTHVVLLLHRAEVPRFSRYAPRVHASHGRFDVIVFRPADGADPAPTPGGVARTRRGPPPAGGPELAGGERIAAFEDVR